MPQTSLSVHAQNLIPGSHPLNSLNLGSHLCLPAQSNLGYQEVSIQNSASFGSLGQNSFNPKHQVPQNSYVNGQQFPYPNQSQQSQNNFPIYHGYEAKDYNPWKESQPPVTWWNSNGGPMVQGLNKELPLLSGTESFHSQNSQHVNNIPLTPGGNNYSQGRLYSGRNNYEDMRQFDVRLLIFSFIIINTKSKKL